MGCLPLPPAPGPPPRWGVLLGVLTLLETGLLTDSWLPMPFTWLCAHQGGSWSVWGPCGGLGGPGHMEAMSGLSSSRCPCLRSTPCPSVKRGDEWGEPSRCDGGDGCQYCHSRTEQQFHPEVYKSTQCNDMRQTGHCPRGPFCAFAHVDKSLGMAHGWGCRTLTSATSSSATSGQPGHNPLAVSAAARLGPSVSSSLPPSADSGSSSPTTPPTLPRSPTGNAVIEVVPGPALDLCLGDIDVASQERDQDEQEGPDLGLTGPGPQSLAGSAPVTIPGSLPRSPSLPSSSSLSASPLSSLSQSLAGPPVCSAMTPPHQPPPRSEPGTLGSSASSYSSLGLSSVSGNVWDFVSGSFSPSPSPILNTNPSPGSAELARVRRQLDKAKRKIRQWEESWQQVAQACDAWQREAQEAKERARVADSDRQLALRRKEEVEARVRQLQDELGGLGVSSLPGLRSCPDVGTIPLQQLHSLQSQLRLDLEAVDGVIFQLRAKQCAACQDRAHGAVLQPCQHRALCELCAASTPECPCCKGQPLPW
ncbi:putative E3 ubiquitin-protein ligase UNKL isoform X2 [Tupaia chinensis]|uniref:putative E3 ubiquitin-protein ligase UNKL isoform X2 n=1 Tax=Tupaia chinensis TaxID=246437 RepID=UPI000FFB7A0D|nr:putative E3 ubiquitin-protein ligase UNKL isoform X2 [Tupaia chinensis]